MIAPGTLPGGSQTRHAQETDDMAHEIDTTTGTAAVFVTGTPAWHRLGRVIAEAASSAEAIRLAGLDWTVAQWPLLACGPTTAEAPAGRYLPCPGLLANVRTDTGAVLGVVSRDYRVFQNWEAFDFMDQIVGEGLARYETAGALKGGRRVWMLAKMPQDIRVTGEDVVHPYILLTNSHDGSMALRMLATTVRVVCANTLNLALGRARHGEGLTIRHCESLEGRVREARVKLGLLTERVEEFTEEARQLAACRLTDRQAHTYFEQFFPTRPAATAAPAPLPSEGLLDAILEAQQGQTALVDELVAGHQEEQTRAERRNARILDSLLESYHGTANKALGLEGTAWGAFNSISGWADHESTVRGKSELERADNRLHSVWWGAANDLKQQAFTSALQLAHAV
jgi:phage/plasmid-like protein (TIGR03299 family)